MTFDIKIEEAFKIIYLKINKLVIVANPAALTKYKNRFLFYNISIIIIF